MATRTALTVGSSSSCDLVLQGAGVAAEHLRILWREGLWVQDLGTGVTSVDGRSLAAGETVQLTGFHAVLFAGSLRVPLGTSEVSQLFVSRSPLSLSPGTPFVIGRDPARAHILADHPTVSGAHARIDPSARTLTDLGSTSGTFDHAGQKLPANHPVPFDPQQGFFLGMVWIPASVALALARAQATPVLGSASQPASPTALPGGGFAPIEPGTAHSSAQPSPQAASHASTGSTPSPVSAFAAAALSARGTSPAQHSGPHAPVAPPAGRGRTVFGEMDISQLPQIGGGGVQAVIGRLPTNEIVLPYPQLSGRHAAIVRTADGRLEITDLGSTNGTYVRGARLAPNQAVAIEPGEQVFIGPYPVIVEFDGRTIVAYVEQDRNEWSGNQVEIEALDLFLKVPDRDNRAKDRILLNHITFKARPGDLIALMGPSGAGKTTLLTVLNGYLHPSSGEVRVNGENLYAIYDALRGSIGYVPQDDIVHPELTVWEAIKYSARFRLPPDFSEEEIDRRVEQVIKDLGLEPVKHLEIGKPERKVLSGGQRKRVNIALELVTDPALMFLDEPTSGLAADDTVALIDLLSNLAKTQGKTIIVTIHQPAREEYEKFNLALVMGYGGEPVYFGPSGRDSYDFFGRYSAHRSQPIDNPRDMFDLLKQREDEMVASGRYPNRPEARLAAAQAWRAEYFRPDNAVYRKMYSGTRQPGTPGKNRTPARARVPLIRQFRLLLTRYATVKRRDRAGTAIMLAQAPIIGGLIAMVFSNPRSQPNMWCRMFLESQEGAARMAGQPLDPACLADATRFKNVSDLSGALFFLTVAAIWFGTSNAAREIVSELAIYRRERMVNLSIPNYVLSKFTLLSALCVVQCTVLLGIVYPAVGLGNGDGAAFVPMLAMMVVTAMCAVGTGLLLSTMVVSSEAAMALTPIALIPQVVLGGRMVAMTTKAWLKPVMAFVPARWSFEGLLGIERLAVADDWHIRACASNGDGIEGGFFDCALEEVRNTDSRFGGLGFATYDQPVLQYMVLFGMTAVVMLAVVALLKRRDSV